MFKYSYNELVYANEGYKAGIERVANYGYDGIELAGENPAEDDPDEINALLDQYDVEASSLCGIYTEDRDLSTPDTETRENAIKYLKDCINLAADLGAEIVGVGPSPVNKIYPDTDIEREQKLAVKSIVECAEYASSTDVQLAIEPWNRYETYFLNRLDQAVELANRVNMENVGVRADLFHMNIEESSPLQALRNASDNLIHVHGADTNRAAPGRGYYEWVEIVKTLDEIDYNGYITFELLPASADPFRVLEGGKDEAAEFYDQYTKESIEVLKEVQNSLNASQ